jgi:NAD(P)-dependent dehydrogenase (short-subunit alcohol dehydrogenase family)
VKNTLLRYSLLIMQLPSVVITGVSRGIGAAMAQLLRDRGYAVTGSARTLGAAAFGVLPLDLSSDKSIARFAASISSPVDILINNAGTATSNQQSGRMEEEFERLTRGEFNHILDTNVVGTFMLTRAMLPQLRRGRRKIIINLSSNLGSIFQNDSGRRYAYRCSKAALNMLTKTLAVDLGREGFTCIAWSPGWVKTDMGGAEAELTPEQSAAALVDFIPEITAAQNGQFLDHRRQPLPW